MDTLEIWSSMLYPVTNFLVVGQKSFLEGSEPKEILQLIHEAISEWTPETVDNLATAWELFAYKS